MTYVTSEDPPPVSSTRTVDRALALLTSVLESASAMSLSELARTTELSASTASRLLATLMHHGLVAKTAEGKYRSGIRMKQLAAATLREEVLYESVGPHLDALVEETHETACLGIASGTTEVLYLRQVASTLQVQTAVWTGRTIPREGTALGAALGGATTPRGFVTSQRPDSDVTAVASPVLGHDGEILGAISINAPTYRTTSEDIERFGTALAAHARELSLALGAPAYLVGGPVSHR